MLDLYNREVIGWSLSESHDEALTMSELGMALETNKPLCGLIHHSDRESNYTSNDYKKVLISH